MIHQPPSRAAAWREIVAVFTKLGLISFGGPFAHMGYFQTEFVQRRRWLDDATFADLVALCQFLPGPASSQTVYAICKLRGGTVGAILGSICFMAPSAAMMILFAYGVEQLGDLASAGWLHGLKLAAVAVVAQAVWHMGRRLCTDRIRLTLCLMVASFLILVHGPWAQIGAILFGGLAGWIAFGRTIAAAGVPREHAHTPTGGRKAAAGVLVVFFALLLILPIAAKVTHDSRVAAFDSFYRAGALVFGGAHAVLPLLRAEVVLPGWVSDNAFLAGYGAVQAVPGPMYTFAAYLGTVMHPGRFAALMGMFCMVAVYLPALLLIAGALPFWDSLRQRAWAQAAMRGANAAVVGVLLAALYDPVMSEGVHTTRDVVAVLLGFAALHAWALPPWALVLAMAAAGQWLI